MKSIEEQEQVVRNELNKLPNLDKEIFVGNARFSTYEVTIEVPNKKFAIANGSMAELVHGIRALKLTGLDGTVENIEKGMRAFDMLQSIYAYNRCMSAKRMSEEKYFTEDLYNIGTKNVEVMAQYLIDNTASIKTDVYTDDEGCSYNSLSLEEI